jgi:hypothetical protein
MTRFRPRRGIAIGALVSASIFGAVSPGLALQLPGWSLETTPLPAGAAGAQLSGVSCVPSGQCTAVGFYWPEQNPPFTYHALIERWNGRAWSLQAAAVPSGATISGLSAVSCPSASRCFAVGSYQSNATSVSDLNESWDGSSWSVQAAPFGTCCGLAAISCSSASACTAVDFFGGVERWNGSSWAFQIDLAAPYPTGLSGVSCATSAACTVVGSVFQPAPLGMGDYQPLAAHWDGGSSWHAEAAPKPFGESNQPRPFGWGFEGVSCTAANACTAVGNYPKQNGMDKYFFTFAERWNGSKWTVQYQLPFGISSDLSAVSCVSATTCVAVGHHDLQTLAEQWSTAAWVLLPTPNPKGALESTLQSVSCTRGHCQAVGWTVIGTHTTALAEGFTLP